MHYLIVIRVRVSADKVKKKKNSFCVSQCGRIEKYKIKFLCQFELQSAR